MVINDHRRVREETWSIAIPFELSMHLYHLVLKSENEKLEKIKIIQRKITITNYGDFLCCRGILNCTM